MQINEIIYIDTHVPVFQHVICPLTLIHAMDCTILAICTTLFKEGTDYFYNHIQVSTLG